MFLPIIYKYKKCIIQVWLSVSSDLDAISKINLILAKEKKRKKTSNMTIYMSFLRFHDCVFVLNLKISNAALVPWVTLNGLGVAWRVCVFGKSSGVHGLPVPQILTCTIKKTNIFRYYLKLITLILN